MAPITVDWTVLSRAAGTYSTAHDSAGKAISALVSTLNENWGCAGKCDIAKKFTKDYDPAASEAVKAGANIANAYGKMHDLLAHTAVNHQNAESAAKTPPGANVSAPANVGHYTPPAFRGAYGQGIDAPTGWSVVAPLLTGHDWPDGDPAKLRALGTAWRAAASSLRATSTATCTAGTEITEQESPEIDQAAAQVELVSNTVEDTASLYEKLASGCDRFAQDVEDTQNKIRSALKTVAICAGVGLVVGGILGGLAGTVVEPGGGTIAGGVGGGAEGASIGGGALAASAAAEILPFLITLDTAVIADSAIIGSVVGGAIGGVGHALDDLLNSTATVYMATAAGSNPRSGLHEPIPAPKTLEGFPDAKPDKKKTPVRGGGSLRPRWKDKKGKIYEWDSKKGTVEKYSKDGKTHEGEFDPKTGEQVGKPVPGRTVEK
ncbi:Colicin E3 catalytic [Segniliparus rotundus DSM 44985]|uniref:Colicin E3 catalytic n=1 Tax=Segniliparus rotundus (strain ATCC BAA-972 / CDC 1076 / CIP 108378 / DSM 44985 / JCM 13578) TaxID=640132 RepID=D6ZDX2_SEGRD|nr:colicin E3/pyocin S6 family cytotoxin [Segniliparus rotundus]ADG99379.1 Colicin E3 catalytic [Segniliparus rotundus DSM 44985]